MRTLLFRVVMSLVVIAVLVGVFVLTQQDSPDSSSEGVVIPQQQQDSPVVGKNFNL